MNSCQPFREPSAKVSPKRGFAIVMALSLLSLVFLLVISLVNLVGIDLTLGDARKERVLAQAHARMGMMVAIGELQKHLGPDTRVSATADILDERIESGRKYENQAYKEGASASISSLIPRNEAIDLNENGQLDVVPFGQRYWTGVWKHRARRKGVTDDKRAGKPLPKNSETGSKISGTPMYDSEYDPHPAIEVAWLVSGNEGWARKLAHMEGEDVKEYVEVPDGIPLDQRWILKGNIYGNQPNAWEDYKQSLTTLKQSYDHPLNELPDPEDSDDTIWILKKPLLSQSYDSENPDAWKDHLSSEPIKVSKTRIRSMDSSADPHTSHGAYAYWVSDEGIKSKINVVNPLKDSDEQEDKEVQIAVALEPNIEEGSFDLKFDPPAETPYHKSKIVSLGFLAKDEYLEGEEMVKKNKLSTNYHSVTVSSYGLLSDTRTGGLKRDLSHAFANDDDWDQGNLDSLSNSTGWARDFLDFIFRDRIQYIKDIPMDPSAKANVWYNTQATQALNDYNAILAGPFWAILGTFHNLYDQLKIEKNLSNQSVENMPRVSGDNFVVFNSGDNQLPAGNNPFWENINDLKIRENEAVAMRLNYFRDFHQRPGPKKHAVQPVLLEVKYSHIPTVSEGSLGNQLALAMYPSVALWNPYNVDIKMDELFIEVPISNVSLHAFNPKDLDRWRKWYFFAFNAGNSSNGGGNNGGGPPRPPPPRPPPSWPRPFGARGPIGLFGEVGLSGQVFNNLFARVEPTPNEPRIPKSSGDHACGKFFHEVLMRGNPQHYRPRGGVPSFSAEFAYKRFQILKTNPAVDKSTGNFFPYRESHRHLLLKIMNVDLKAGEKSHFTTAGGQTWDWKPRKPLGASPRQYLQILLNKGVDNQPFICRVPYVIEKDENDKDQPLAVRYELGNIVGIDPRQSVAYSTNATVMKNTDIKAPKGISMYRHSPSSVKEDENFYTAKNVDQRKPIFTLAKSFSLNFDNDWLISKNPLTDLEDNILMMGTSFMPGDGFRIRYKLPGSSDKVVLEQFNIRSVVSSMQDGGGDNWSKETFMGIRAKGRRPYHFLNSLPEISYTYDLPGADADGNPMTHKDIEFTPQQFKFYDFYKLPRKIESDDVFDEIITTLDPAIPSDPFNLNNQIVPRISSSSHNIGYFHDPLQKHGSAMEPEANGIQNASLFDIPTSPMLSILQLRHANLSDYSHAPSYILGNSYATSQVGRYKTWGRMRAISKEIENNRFSIGHNEASQTIWNKYYSEVSPWKAEIALLNLYFPGDGRGYGPIRDPDAQIDHQNTTVDHSFYANRALLDGYFMSGVGLNEWRPKSLAGLEVDAAELFSNPKNRDLSFAPYRNKRLKSYWVKTQMRESSFGEKSKFVQDGVDSDFRYQTMAADLLVDGAFNINSTSVDAWISQLSSLRGVRLPNASSKSSETPFPRFINHPSTNSWNQVRSLNDDEISLLAHCLVEQIKLRGPFLSYSDFVNRRIQGNIPRQGSRANRLDTPWENWDDIFPETRDSVLGFRGAVQSAIAEAEINQSQFQKQGPNGNSFTGEKGEWPNNPMIPYIPKNRFYPGGDVNLPTIYGLDQLRFISTPFGMHAIYQGPISEPKSLDQHFASFTPSSDPLNPDSNKKVVESFFGRGKEPLENKYPGNISGLPGGDFISFKIGWDDYSSALEFGEAPENILAVENVATAANKPGWLMQSDVLSPLAPVTSARSDTFIIRVMGEPKGRNSNKVESRAWIEVTVQRIPDYIKPGIDAPHHRPHEPFEDRNFNGYWDNDPSFVEHWLDLNQNGMDSDGEQTLQDAVPDLPGVGTLGKMKFFADGLYSDLHLNEDPEEEPVVDKASRMGINQRFGRKFKIVGFRWIKDQDV